METLLRPEVAIWLIANLISFVIATMDLRITLRVYRWTRSKISGDMLLVAKRNLRSSLLKFLLATCFLSAGVFAVTSVGVVVWALVSGAVLLTADIVLEARYRRTMFASPTSDVLGSAAERRIAARTDAATRGHDSTAELPVHDPDDEPSPKEPDDDDR